MKKVLVNEGFKDKYTGQVYEAGNIYTFSNERVAEVKEVNKNFLEVIGNVEDGTNIDTGIEEVSDVDEFVDDEIVDDEIVSDEVVEEKVAPEESGKKSTRKNNK